MRTLFALIIFHLASLLTHAQKADLYHHKDDDAYLHRLYIEDNYLIETVFSEETGSFIFTRGGYMEIVEHGYRVQLEFNSNFSQDSIKSYVFKLSNDWEKESVMMESDLDGHWQFSGRILNDKEERRELNLPRKTIKILCNGVFQWIAFNAATMKFSGTGGGTFTATNGVYEENLQYFSRDKSRVGAKLNFNFSVIGGEWHHTGNNSKGDPLHEIWVPRP